MLKPFLWISFIVFIIYGINEFLFNAGSAMDSVCFRTDLNINCAYSYNDIKSIKDLGNLCKFEQNYMHLIGFGYNGKNTRQLYNILISIPNCVRNDESLDICEKAKYNYYIRKHIKQYTRKHGSILVYLYSILNDKWRNGYFNGMTPVALWNKKTKKFNDTEITTNCYINDKRDELYKLWNKNHCSMVCESIVHSSIKTNKDINKLMGILNNYANNNKTEF